jgi:type I restriction-modification system DNA methylase subunit
MKYEPKREKIGTKFYKGVGYVRDLGTAAYIPLEEKRREFGAHLTSIDIFKKFIFPEIKDILYKYTWLDLFCGEGNLILPILEAIPKNERINFFKEHIFLFDIQKEMVEKSIANAKKYGIPYKVAKNNIQLKDTLQDYPDLKSLKYPPYHITNPPYLYIGYIVKNSERNLKYFSGLNEGYQDLYQIALINDLRHGLENLIYIIPTNFLFGFSVSNKIRKDFLSFYNIKKAIIFEKKIFEFTGTNVCICFFNKKKQVSQNPIVFKALKINSRVVEREYNLLAKNFYRAGGEFDEYVSYFKSSNPLKINFYLTLDEVMKNRGQIEVKLLDVNNFSNGYFKFSTYLVNEKFYNKLKNNPLFVRTLDTGGWDGRAGIYNVKETFGVDGIVVTKEKYRTHPIQIFIAPELSEEDLVLLKNYFNLMLEYFRDITDSEFLTTFKYSNSDYIRKYLGLSQVKKLLETFAVHLMSESQKKILRILIDQKNIEAIKDILLNLNKKVENQITIFNNIYE